MSIVQSFLTEALNTSDNELHGVMRKLISDSPFVNSLMPNVDALLQADDQIVDELWKFSVTFSVPHQLFFDAFQLQRSLNSLFHGRRLVG